MLRLGIDIGGTFTDFVVFHPQTGQVETFKLLSTPHDPAEAVLAGLQQIGLTEDNAHIEIVHGTTVATNALLERKGARTALVTTRGFADVLQIGRQNRPELYNLSYTPPPPLIPSELRFEVDERIDHTGQVLTPLDPAQVDTLLPLLQQQQIESVAVCLLFSFLHPAHEQLIAAKLRAAGFLVSASCEILPEFREYERTSTTVINAYVSPILDRYLSRLEQALFLPSPRLWGGGGVNSLRIMQSNGGAISLGEARRNGVRCILSGPAGGIVGAQRVTEAVSQPASKVQLITFDMGGTSTDVSLIDGEPLVTSDAQVSGLPIRIPVLDIHTIGAGGGSIAYLDPGGALRVGPQSAGADPGPACYNPDPSPLHPERAFPTVTDANLVLGRLPPDHFLGGAMPLNLERACWVMQRLGEPLGLDPLQTALGVVEIVDAHMERALRLVSVERGHDPRFFSLLSFGGAGGLHACSLARRLGIPQIIVPPYASVLSAFGMLAVDIVKDYSQTVMLLGSTPPSVLADMLAPLLARARHDLLAEGLQGETITFQPQLDMRYQGQSYELTVPWPSLEQNFLEGFQSAHQSTYGYTLAAAPVEIVNLRLHAVGHIPPIPLPSQPPSSSDPQLALLDRRPVVLASPPAQLIPLYRGEALCPGNRIQGPALIVRSDTTIFLTPSDVATVDPYLNLLIKIG
jgi:N-methylhydantoinase A